MSISYKFGIVEDHSYWRHTLVEIIKNNFTGAEIVIEAGDGNTFIEKLTRLETKLMPHIVILDLHMPNRNGFSTAQWLNLNQPLIKILTLSLLLDERAIIHLLKFGVLGFLHKSINGQDLINGIEAVLEGQFFFSNFENTKGESNSISLHSLSKTKDVIDKWDSLSNLDKQFIRLCCTDRKYSEIARDLKIDISTLEILASKIFTKFEVSGRIPLVLMTHKAKLI